MLATLRCLPQPQMGREKERECLACVMDPMLLDVWAWHPIPHYSEWEVLISIGPAGHADLSLNRFNQGRRSARSGNFSPWSWPLCSSYLRSQATGSSAWPSVSWQPTETKPSLLSSIHHLAHSHHLLLLTLSHTHHPLSPLKWHASPRQRKRWRQWPCRDWERSGGKCKGSCRVWEAVVRSERWIEDKTDNRRSNRCVACTWHSSICLWIYSGLFGYPFLGEFLWSALSLSSTSRRERVSLHCASYPSDWNQIDQSYQFTLLGWCGGEVELIKDLAFLRNYEVFSQEQSRFWVLLVVFFSVPHTNMQKHLFIPFQPHPLLDIGERFNSFSCVKATGLDCWKWTWNTCRL